MKERYGGSESLIVSVFQYNFLSRRPFEFNSNLPIQQNCNMAPKKKAASSKEEETMTRIAIVGAERCKPKKCGQECKKSCPVVKLGKMCIEVDAKSKIAFISEPLCIGTFTKSTSSSRTFEDAFSPIMYNLSSLFQFFQDVVFASKSARSKLLTSSISPRISRKTRHTVTVQTHSSCIDFLCLVRGRYSAWSEPTVSVSRQHLKSWREK